MLFVLVQRKSQLFGEVAVAVSGVIVSLTIAGSGPGVTLVAVHNGTTVV